MNRQPTERQKAYVNGVMEGKTRHRSAVEAGYANAIAPEFSATVKQEIAKAREQLTDITTIKRVDVIDGIMDGIACARMQGDSGNIIKGWTEVAKILGYYAPEVKTINLNLSQQRMRTQFETLSDEELLAIAEGKVVDVEAKTLS